MRDSRRPENVTTRQSATARAALAVTWDPKNFPADCHELFRSANIPLCLNDSEVADPYSDDWARTLTQRFPPGGETR